MLHRIVFIITILLYNAILAAQDIAVVTLAVGKEYQNVVAAGIENKKQYCELHGYDFICEKELLDPSRPIPWSKIPLLLRVMENSSYKWIFWTDADSLVMNLGFPLEDLIDEKYKLIITKDFTDINAGQFLLRNCEESRNFLKEVYSHTECINHPWWSQQAMILEINKQNSTSFSKIIPQRLINSYPTECSGKNLYSAYQSGDFIVHFAGQHDLTLLSALFKLYSPLVITKVHNRTLDEFLYKSGFDFTKEKLTITQFDQFNELMSKPPKIETITQVGMKGGHKVQYLLDNFSNIKKITSFENKMSPYTLGVSEYLSNKYEDRFEFINGDSLVAIRDYVKKNPTEKSDFIYIDGDTSYEYCLSNILNAQLLAHADTILWINNYDEPNVRRAVKACSDLKILSIDQIQNSSNLEDKNHFAVGSYLQQDKQSSQKNITNKQKLTLNLCSQMNDGGLENDQKIMGKALEQLGYKVQCVNYFDKNNPPKADINIFFERLRPEWFSYAIENWFVPNPEWYYQGLELLDEIDLILCRTKEIEKVFKENKQKTFFLGFTSHDCSKPEIKKDYSKILHLAGISKQKGTSQIVNIWKRNPSFPLLVIIKHWFQEFFNQDNYKLIPHRVDIQELREYQNGCGIHLCPSETEGFGHYIMEAMSVGAVVLTTNAPPMNEFITDPRCLVGYERTAPQYFATNYFVDEKQLESTINNIIKLSNEELEKIGSKNRENYLRKTAEFNERLSLLMDTYHNPTCKKTNEDIVSTNGCTKKLKINVCSGMNGVGLVSDQNIMADALKELGHHVECISDSSSDMPPNADINIFFQRFRPDWFSVAKQNWFVPNPEWYCQGLEALNKIDLILCRTKEVERIFNYYKLNTYYTGFTSLDCYNPKIAKDYKLMFHLAGGSCQKGTPTIVNLWRSNLQFPRLNIIKHSEFVNLDQPNYNLIPYRVDDQTLRTYQNSCGIHLCPSETEGFGHYISEAMSAGAVIITTNGPPMNEFITDSRCLVNCERTNPQWFAMNYYVDSKDLERVINNLTNMSDQELKSIGEKNRQVYLENKKLFKERLKQLLESDLVEKKKNISNEKL
ncbi:MAG: glycosyltransferase [Parachlamydiaceae bacterium]|nr:glycosyltransferase [Parachlamydiaceae bacterium]